LNLATYIAVLFHEATIKLASHVGGKGGCAPSFIQGEQRGLLQRHTTTAFQLETGQKAGRRRILGSFLVFLFVPFNISYFFTTSHLSCALGM
jgi:hypothetical protein